MIFILTAMVAALAALLLTGCQEGNRTKDPSQKENVEQAEIKADSLKRGLYESLL